MSNIEMCNIGTPCLFNAGSGHDEAEQYDVSSSSPAVVKRLVLALKRYDAHYHPSSDPAPDETDQMCEMALENGGWVTPFKQ